MAMKTFMNNAITVNIKSQFAKYNPWEETDEKKVSY